MKQKVLRTISCVFIIIIFMALSGCSDIFHSKEDIDYMDIILNKEYSNSVKEGSRNYYMFHAEQNVTYYILWYIGGSYKLKVATFWYDTGGTVTGEKEDNYHASLSFSSARSGDVVVRITAKNDYSSKNTADYKFMVSTSEKNTIR